MEETTLAKSFEPREAEVKMVPILDGSRLVQGG